MAWSMKAVSCSAAPGKTKAAAGAGVTNYALASMKALATCAIALMKDLKSKIQYFVILAFNIIAMVL